jgi:hypothetical protein
MDLALPLLQLMNFVWLCEHKLLLAEYVMFVWFVLEECAVSNGEVGEFSLVDLSKLHIPSSLFHR